MPYKNRKAPSSRKISHLRPNDRFGFIPIRRQAWLSASFCGFNNAISNNFISNNFISNNVVSNKIISYLCLETIFEDYEEQTFYIWRCHVG